jgi:AcrR family transcriptional regulator
MTQIEKNTENQILEAAKKVFLEKGMAGARMQEIADAAGINKSLLHYYYRSKDKLFLAVFRFAVLQFLPGIQEMITSDIHFEEKIRRFVHRYIDILLENPFVPMFIIQEIQRDPDRLFNAFVDAGIKPDEILRQFKKAVDDDEIRDIDPRDLVVNLLSLCIFPVAAKPVMQRLLTDNNSDAYREFIEKRKETVPEFILNAIKK